MITSAFIFFAALGFGLSLYAFSIERTLQKNPNYRPACNISDRISCTAPIVSPYGKLFGFSNVLLGLVFYPFLALLAVTAPPIILLIATSGLLFFTVFLAYILFFKVKAICPICIALYMVNISLFLLSREYVG